MYYTNEQIAYTADRIITSRDFCGNEKEASQDAAEELGIKWSIKLYRMARYRANGKWNQYQRQAGVKEKYLF